MKKILIIVLAILLAASAGILAYGVTQGTQETFEKNSEGLLAAPDANAAKEGAAHWYSPEAVMENKTQAEKVANLLIYTAYNHINAKQFYFEAHMEMTAGGHEVISDYFRAQQGLNYFYNACAYPGSGGNATRRVEYVDQRLDLPKLMGIAKMVSATYDKDSKTFSYSMPKAVVTNKELEATEETPYVIYSWYDFPLDLGGLKSAESKDASAGRSEEIDASLIKTVQIDAPTDEKPYYTLTFNADVTKLNESRESLYRISESLAKQVDLDKGIDVQEFSCVVEIWPVGLFRSISISSRMTATVKGDKGNAEMRKTIQFSYSDVDCSVAYLLRMAPGNWESFLSDANQAICESEIDKLPLKEDEE